MPFRGVKILVFFIFILALFSSTNGAAAKTNKPMGTVGSKGVSLRGVGGPLCYCNWWGWCYYCTKGVYKCYMCRDGVHCCYDDTPVCCSSGIFCCPSDSSCCSDTSSCCPSDTPNCCPNPELCCPEDKPVCCEDPNHCCEEDTTCCGEECCNSDQKCCTDNDNKKYCCGKDADCCGDQCCKENTECCELLDGGGSKNACLSYQKDEEQLPAHPEVLTNELFQSLGGNGQLVILAVAVGQGDCTIIYCPNNNDIVIVDMGASPGGQYVTGDDMKAYLMSYFQKYPNANMYNLVTHPNVDHYNYFPTAVQDIPTNRVRCFVLGGVGQDISPYLTFGTWLNKYFKNRIYVINNGYPCYGNVLCSIHLQSDIGQQLSPQFCGNDVTFTIMAANQGSTPNPRSTVLKVQYGTWSALLPGDFETATAQTNIVNHYRINPPGLKSSCYKIAHHGASAMANFPNFLEAINPEAAFVSQMYPSEVSCHHPRRETIERLQDVMREGERVARSSVSPFAYWNRAEEKVQVNTKFCFPIYATCRQVGTCNNIIIRSTGVGSATIDYASATYFPKVAAADPVSIDDLDCEDEDDDAREKYISEDEAKDGVPEETAQHPASHQEL